jgi:hypothetical protein
VAITHALVADGDPLVGASHWNADHEGSGLPAGGTEGQALIKQSGVDGDADWGTHIFAPPSVDGLGGSIEAFAPNNSHGGDIDLIAGAGGTGLDGGPISIAGGAGDEGTGAAGGALDIGGGQGGGDGVGGGASFLGGASLSGVELGATLGAFGGSDDEGRGGEITAVAGSGTRGGRVDLAGGNGAAGWFGGDASIAGGSGDDGSDLGAYMGLGGGVGDGTPGIITIVTGGLEFNLLAGTADPSSGAGVTANILSTYRRDNAGTGELWFKTGAADTDWTQVV